MGMTFLTTLTSAQAAAKAEDVACVTSIRECEPIISRRLRSTALSPPVGSLSYTVTVVLLQTLEVWVAHSGWRSR